MFVDYCFYCAKEQSFLSFFFIISSSWIVFINNPNSFNISLYHFGNWSSTPLLNWLNQQVTLDNEGSLSDSAFLSYSVYMFKTNLNSKIHNFRKSFKGVLIKFTVFLKYRKSFYHSIHYFKANITSFRKMF